MIALVAGVDLNHRPLGYELRGKLQIQLLCGADDNPRRRMNTGRYEKRDPYLTRSGNGPTYRGMLRLG